MHLDVRVWFSSEVQLRLCHTRALTSQPPACRRASHFMKMELKNMEELLLCNINSFALNIVQFLQRIWFVLHFLFIY
jgi:hypothetical protein